MSVIVKYDPYGRMGNRMFQYAFGYIIAKLKGCNFYHGEINNFQIPNIPFNGILNNPLNTKSLGNQYVNIDLLLHHNGDIIVDSFLQKSQYYLNYRDDLRELFNYKKRPSAHKSFLTIHIRETDYTQLGAFLGYEFYSSLILNFNFNKVLIVTDNSKCNTVQRLIADGCELSSHGCVDTFDVNSDKRGMQDFETLLYSENIAISQSSFSWWAAFLGDHNNIIFPYKKNIEWWPIEPGVDDIDLYYDLGHSKRYINNS